MKIAALIRAHQKPENLDILLERLSGPLWKPLVHFNRLANIEEFSPRARAAAIATRIPVYWGGWSMVEASLLLMRSALRDPEVTHLYLLSGQCYPLKSDAQMEQYVDSLPKGAGNLLTLGPMPAPTKPLNRLSRWHFNDLPPGLLKSLATFVAPLLPRRRNARRVLEEMPLRAGCAWWLFERASAERVLEFVGENGWFVDAFRWSLVPDEMFFQILVVAIRIPISGLSPTFTKWIQGRSSPETVTAEIYREAVSTDRLFSRKFEDFYPPADPEAEFAQPRRLETKLPAPRVRIRERVLAFVHAREIRDELLALFRPRRRFG